MRMEKLVLKRTVGRQHYLSFLSEPHMIPESNITLPFCEGIEEVECSSCRGLFYFNDFSGKSGVCNLTTNEVKVFDPPRTRGDAWSSCGLGYDPKSDDYKVIREHEDSSTAEVFSFKRGSWKTITGPGYDVDTESWFGVYLEAEGRCYWVARPWMDKGDVKLDEYIISFDFSDETFSRMPLPPQPDDGKLLNELFDFEGCLSVVGYRRVEDHNDRLAKYFEVHVWRRGSWELLFSVVLVDCQRPLGLRDGRLFLEGRSSKCKHSSPLHLMTYDWEKEELREHAKCDMMSPGKMFLLSYVENRVAIPDARPINGEKTLNEKGASGICHSSSGSV
ncbi:hypothetical protein OROHE_005219 [Orobanche hederae]